MKSRIPLGGLSSAMFRAYTLASLCSGSFLLSQVGINTPDPKSTLDIQAKSDGSTKTGGLMIPRLTGDQIQTMSNSIRSGTESLMIYATSVPASPDPKLIKITQPGYYYWNGTSWHAIGANNINTTD